MTKRVAVASSTAVSGGYKYQRLLYCPSFATYLPAKRYCLTNISLFSVNIFCSSSKSIPVAEWNSEAIGRIGPPRQRASLDSPPAMPVCKAVHNMTQPAKKTCCNVLFRMFSQTFAASLVSTGNEPWNCHLFHQHTHLFQVSLFGGDLPGVHCHACMWPSVNHHTKEPCCVPAMENLSQENLEITAMYKLQTTGKKILTNSWCGESTDLKPGLYLLKGTCLSYKPASKMYTSSKLTPCNCSCNSTLVSWWVMARTQWLVYGRTLSPRR